MVAANRLDDNDVSGFVLNMRDATERLRLQRKLRAFARQRERDATHDPLTALPNRRGITAALGEAIARAEREHGELALVMLDLDRFKEFNDALGHAAGDELLRELSRRLVATSPGAELVGRIDGDEFAIVLPPGTATAEGEALARALRAALISRSASKG